MKPVKTYISISIFMMILLVAPVAGYCESSAQTVLKQAIDDILTILKDPMFATDDPKIKNRQQQVLYDRIHPVFAFDLLSRGALGVKLKLFSSEQLDEFTYYFSKLITSTYFHKIEGNDIETVTISYLDSIPIKSKNPDIQLVDIDTRIIQEKLEIPVVYRMIRQMDTQWKIYDIRIEGVSMTANYREQYRSRISDSPADIISEIKQKVEP